MGDSFFWLLGVAVSFSAAFVISGFAIGLGSVALWDGMKNSWRYVDALRQIRRWERAVKRRKKGGGR